MATDKSGGKGHASRAPLIIEAKPDAPEGVTATPKGAEGAGAAGGAEREAYSLHIAAAAVGGVVGLGAALTLASLGLWPGRADLASELQTERARSAQLVARLDEATRRLETAAKAPAAAPQADGAALASLQALIKGIETRLAKAEALAEPVARLERAGEDMSRRVQALASGIPAGQAPSVVDPALADKLGDVTAKVEALSGMTGRVDELTRRLNALTAQGEEIANARGDIDSLRRDLDGARATLSDLRAVPGMLASLSTRSSAIDATLKAQDAKIAGVAAARSEAVLALALANLKAAVDAGRPYAADLAVASRLSGASDDLAALGAGAATGIATLGALNAQFPEIARRILETSRPAPTGGSLMDRFIAHASQSVSVRRIDQAAGDSTAAKLSRVGVALQAGDAGRAAGEWQSLSEAERGLAPAFGAALAARASVDAALDRAARGALDRLSRSVP